MIIKGNNLEPATINYSYSNSKFYLNDHAYIPILKNAHRLTVTIALAYGFNQNDDIVLTDKIKLVTLRDPIERWYAGMSQIIQSAFPELEINESLVDLLTRIIVMDGHTRSQANYLSGINTDECVFFNMDDPNYKEHFQHYCSRTFGGAVDLNDPKLNKSATYNTSTLIYTNLKSKLKKYCRDEFKLRLKKYYAEDYELLNSVKFYSSDR